MVSEVYDALLDAGASQEKARKAAEAVAGYDDRFARLEHETAGGLGDVKRETMALRGDVKQEVASIRGELNLLKWMVGFNTAAVIAVLLKLLFP